MSRIISGNKVLLPDQDQPQPATIVLDPSTGKIVNILTKASVKADFPDVAAEDWIDAADNIVMPGIVE